MTQMTLFSHGATLSMGAPAELPLARRPTRTWSDVLASSPAGEPDDPTSPLQSDAGFSMSSSTSILSSAEAYVRAGQNNAQFDGPSAVKVQLRGSSPRWTTKSRFCFLTLHAC